MSAACAYHSSICKALVDVTELLIGDQSVHFLLHDLPQLIPRNYLQMRLLHSESLHLPSHLLCHTGIQRLHLGGGKDCWLIVSAESRSIVKLRKSNEDALPSLK